MPRQSKTDQEIGYIRSYWDEIREMEADYKGVVACVVDYTSRPGVLIIRHTFVPIIGGQRNFMGTQAHVIEFPNSQQGSLASTLWAASLKLLALVEQASFHAGEAPTP